VDALGGIDEAVETAAELAGLGDYELVSRTGKKDYLREFLEKQLDDVKAALVKSVAGEEYKYLKELKRLKQRSGVLALLPYDVTSM